MTKKLLKDQSAVGQFGSAIAQICEEKGIDKDRVIDSVELALAAAYKKDYGRRGQLIVAKFSEVTGTAEFKQLKEVVNETTRIIEEEEVPDSAHEIPKKAEKSQETAQRWQRDYAAKDEEETLSRFNPERDILLEDAKKIDKKIQVGDFIEIPLEEQNEYGRVASQTAKQVIIQRIREAERDAMFDEYKGKEGEVISGSVQRVEMGKVYIEMGKAVGVLFPSEQIPGEQYRAGQRLRVYVDKVESDMKGPGVVLSRKHPNLLMKLFELEVPEIFAGTVQIKAVAREAGNRAKIAVTSTEEGIDPIGSCVGQKGTRVQAVIDELNGEKIDIIEWSDDVEKMIAAALAPAKVAKVTIEDEEEKQAKAFVAEDQLSLAIGKRGQNVRLAVKLTGWKIDVESLTTEGADEPDSVDEETPETPESAEENNEKEEKVEEVTKLPEKEVTEPPVGKEEDEDKKKNEKSK